MSNTESPNTERDETGTPKRAGFVALIGATNSGKSTLLNRVVGAKVSIVSRKVQTTRALVRGIVIKDATQIIFVDTPGIFDPRRRLDRAMVSTAWSGAADADLVALMIDARKGIADDDLAILDRFAAQSGGANKPVLLLNKIDLVARDTLLDLAQRANDRVEFAATFMISAQTGDGVDDMLDYFVAILPQGPWLYPEDQMTDVPMRMLAAEITREKLMDRLHQELPYASTVETEAWTEGKKGIRIEQTIYVERESQRRIVLGKGGSAIKAISMASRRDLTELLEQPVHLFLFVKVRRNWGNDPERYGNIGLEMPKD
ncbi:MAG: GTPase Era [Alphaproteobacteria bacterium]